MATIELSNAGGVFAQPSQRIRLELSERGAARALGNSSAQMAHVKYARLAAVTSPKQARQKSPPRAASPHSGHGVVNCNRKKFWIR